MVTPMTLQDGINDFLQKEVASKYLLKTVNRSGEESVRAPQIIRSGWVIPKSVDDDDYGEEEFPYIATRIDKLEHLKNSRDCTVSLILLYGVYDPGAYDESGRLIDDGSGYRDLWNLIESTRQALFAASVIEKRYRIIDDYFEAGMFNEQIYPYWEGYCITKWLVTFPFPPLRY